MQKIKINNRRGQSIVLVLERSDNSRGLAFVMHGLGDSKDSDHIKVFAKSFLDNGYNVVSFDTTNTFGESDGNYEDATITKYYEDLEDVINWAKSQDFYREPFVLCGHSLGGTCTTLYAENYPEEVKALAPFSSDISGKLQEVEYTQEELEKWKQSGLMVEKWPDGEVRLKWAYMEDKAKLDLLTKADQLTMPVLIIVGEFDNCNPLRYQQLLFDKLPGDKELHVVKGAPHTFRDQGQLAEIYQIMNAWIKVLAIHKQS